MKISNIKKNPNNPRIIKDDKFLSLVKSIKDFPEMIVKRPIVCVTDTHDGKIYPIGGNMRLAAICEIGYKEIPDNWVLMADDWTEKQIKEFTIKDNISFGDWDYEDLKNNWNNDFQLNDWGIEYEFSDDLQKNNLTKKEIEIKPYKKTHILLSFPPNKILDLKPFIDKILEIEEVDYEQSSN